MNLRHRHTQKGKRTVSTQIHNNFCEKCQRVDIRYFELKKIWIKYIWMIFISFSKYAGVQRSQKNIKFNYQQLEVADERGGANISSPWFDDYTCSGGNGFCDGGRDRIWGQRGVGAALPMQWSPGLQCLPGDQVSDTEARHWGDTCSASANWASCFIYLDPPSHRIAMNGMNKAIYNQQLCSI